MTADSTPVLVSRRTVLAGGSLLGLALAAGLDLSSCTSHSGSGSKAANKPPARALSAHEHAVIEAASARLVPGPSDDPAEVGHAGAREAKAADYIDIMLGALHDAPPKVYAGGPFSNRSGSRTDDMADFLALDNAVQAHWQARLTAMLAVYQAGVAQLDQVTGGDFTKAPPAAQDTALAKNAKVPQLPSTATGFTDLLFQHTIEGCYGVPEYGGNQGTISWREIGFAGDVQPRGYTPAQVTNSDGPDPIVPTGAVADALKLLSSTAPGSPGGPGSLVRGGS